MEFQIYIQKFIDYLKTEKKYSAHTVVSYSNDLKQIGTYFGSVYRIEQIEDINKQIIRSYIAHLSGEKYDPKSINRKISTLKSFFQYLNKKNLYGSNPTATINTLKVAKKLPQVVDKHKINKLFDTLIERNSQDYNEVLSECLLFFFYHTGCRLSEVIQLKETNVDFGNNTIKVLGKGNKERIIPMTQELKEILIKFNLIKQKNNILGDFFFIFQTGKKIYSKWVYNTIKENIGKISTQQKKSPHILRHSFATHILDEGADLNAIKELLGHANLNATQIYTHNSIEKLKSIHKESHPKGNKKK
jgi:integrase/recombinase XerC